MSAGFANEVVVMFARSGYVCQLREDLIFEDEDGRIYVVPNRFYTDFASIPRFLWRLASPYDPGVRRPSVLHDYLYGLRGGGPYGMSRKGCDDIFLRAMRLEGQAHWRRILIYRAVRTFGGFHSRGAPWIK